MATTNTLTENQEQPQGSPVSESEIATLAYALWEKRGRPHGSPEEDWYQAERALRLKKLTRTFSVRLSSQLAAAEK